jgi:CrcB protein
VTAANGLLVVLGAAVGAPLRFLADRIIQTRHDSVFPWGTLSVNIAGSFLLGMLAAGVDTHGVSDGLMSALGTGFCGALTTYSTFGYETLRLIEDGSRFYATLNVIVNVAAGLTAAFGGAELAHDVWR